MIAIPSFRLEPRLEAGRPGGQALQVLSGAVLAFVLGALFLIATGEDVLVAYGALLRGSFGSVNALSGTLNKAVPIGLCALGIAFAYRARLWNIGAEGQLYMGAFGAAGVGLHLPAETSAIVALPLALAAGMLAGAVWALVAALLKAYRGVNEILTTLMLNYIAILWVGYLVNGPWSDPLVFSFPYSAAIIPGAQVGKLFFGVHAGLVVLCLMAVLLIVIDRSSRIGYELRLAGDAPRAALYGGINQRKLVLIGLGGAGLLAGLAGAIEISGATLRLQSGLSPGYGFMAILVAWIAQGRPLAILLASVLYAALINGGFALQVSGIPPAIGTILQAVLLLSVFAATTFGAYRLRRVPTGRVAT